MASSRKGNEDPWSSSDEDDDDDYDDDEERLTFHSICSYSHGNPSASPVFDTLALALQHDASHCGFDLLRHLAPSTDEDYFFEGTIVLVNKCRQFAKDREGENMDAAKLGKALNDMLKTHRANDDEDVGYYKPVLEDDAVLMCIDEIRELKRKSEVESQDAGPSPEGNDGTNTSNAESETIKRLREQVLLLEEKLDRAKVCIASLAKEEDDASSDESCSEEEGKKRTKKKKKNLPSDNDSYYFSSYSNTTIHETMLRDTVRTAAYEEAILSNSETLFHGKTVLDIGCGTGVLSLFCAKAGAAKVIAVDNSDIINQAERIVKLNGYDEVVTCVRGKIETLLKTNGLPLSPGETVDVIVSEWMGYALFFETMLPSVMAARDAVMTPGTGTMFPNRSKIFLEGGSGREWLGYWDDVHGLDMSPMKERVANELTSEAWVEVVEDKNIVTDRALLIEHDLNACKDEELDFEAPFELRLRDAASSEGDDVVKVHRLVVSFDIDFAVPGTKAVRFSTGCQSAPTHWKQAVMWFDPVHNCPGLSRKGGDVMRGTFRMKRNAENHRAIDMAVIWETGSVGEDGAWARTMDGVLKRSLIA